MIERSHEEVWRQYDAIESRLTAAVSERMLDLAQLRPGQRVLDVASGRGEPALRAAHRVGPAGQVVGVDASQPLLDMARKRALAEGLSNLDLRVGSAESVELPAGAFDAATLRWGLMYFADPIAALSRIRNALRPTSVLVAALWAEPERVPYFSLPRRLLERYSALPPIDRAVPGTFRYDTPARIAQDFTQAGFAISHTEELETAVMESESSAEMLAWVRTFGLDRLLEGLPESTQQAWEADLVSALEASRTGGVMKLSGVTRLVVAKQDSLGAVAQE